MVMLKVMRDIGLATELFYPVGKRCSCPGLMDVKALVLMSIENDILKLIDFTDIIDEFARLKARKKFQV